MDRNMVSRLMVILAVVIGCIWLTIPTYRYFSTYRNLSDEEIAKFTDGELKQMKNVLAKSMKLGLDLQGGMHLVLELDEEELASDQRGDAIERVMQILQTRVDQFGVAEPSIAKQGQNRIVIQLPGVEDPERAKGLIQGLAQLEFRMVAESQTFADVITAIDEALTGKTLDNEGLNDSTATEANDTAADSAATATAADSSLFPELAGAAPATNTDSTTKFIGNFISAPRAGMLLMVDDPVRFRRVNRLLERSEVRAILARNNVEFFWSNEDFGRTRDGLPTKPIYLLGTKVELSGSSLKDASAGPDPNSPSAMLVNFRLDRKGARVFSTLTSKNVGKQMAIVLDEVVKSAPSINSRIPSGSGQISGGFTDIQAKDLAIVLRAGALPVTLNIVEERTVGPTLGADSLSKGLKGAMVGLGLTALFLLVYYQFGGLLAAVALTLNILIVLAAMATLGAALSLPGIAGLVLSVAMAVDANVLIFERIREELLKEKTVKAAIEGGYANALSAIIDSNLTTLFAGVVLLYFGSGPIKGFAVTLCIGIMASMFTALFVTRFFFDLLTRGRSLKKLSI